MEEERPRVALRDVARRAGVSVGTASNVFSERAWVAPATRDAVATAAAELGYRPRPRAPRPAPAGTFGLLLRHGSSPTANPFYSHVLHGAEAACAALGVGLAYEALPPPGDRPRLPLMLEQGRVQGVLVVGYVTADMLALLRDRAIPFVLVDYWVDPMPADGVTGQDERGGWLATRHLLQHGHHDPPPAVIVGPLSHSSFAERLAGYRRALAERALPVDDALVRLGDGSPDHGFAAMHALLDLPRPPTAVFCANDQIALHALRALRERGVAVPEECSLAGYDDVEWAALAMPPLTTIRVDKELLGAQAVWHLRERIAHPAIALRHTRLAVTLVERASVVPPAGGGKRPRRIAATIAAG